VLKRVGDPPKGNYTILPNDLIHDADLSWRAKCVALYLWSLKPNAYISTTGIAAAVGMAKPKVLDAMGELTERRWMMRRENRGPQGRVYQYVYLIHRAHRFTGATAEPEDAPPQGLTGSTAEPVTGSTAEPLTKSKSEESIFDENPMRPEGVAVGQVSEIQGEERPVGGESVWVSPDTTASNGTASPPLVRQGERAALLSSTNEIDDRWHRRCDTAPCMACGQPVHRDDDYHSSGYLKWHPHCYLNEEQ
jgi:hypothetical protein